MRVTDNTEERAVTKFARDAILTILGGLVLEPTLQKIHIDVSPYLREIWFGIGFSLYWMG